MNMKKVFLVTVILGLFLLAACSKSQPSGYATYSQNPQQQQYVGGGCGVASDGNYEDTPVAEINAENLAV